MFLLFESAAGYALFKVSDRVTQLSAEELATKFASEAEAREILDLVCFTKFKDMVQALEAASVACEDGLSKPLKNFLKSVIYDGIDELAVSDSKLGSLIEEKFRVNCLSGGKVPELIRGVRSHFEKLVAKELKGSEFLAMSLGLAHSLCRFKLKFNTDQLDSMIIQAIGLLEELDRELNNYVMRCREWYGWHFPELDGYFPDGLDYVKAVKCIGRRSDLDARALARVFSEAQAHDIEELSLHSMGTEITEDDQMQIQFLCTEVIELHEYRAALHEYLLSRMNALAPNVTNLVGELVGAKMIAKAGSLLNLAKSASSTVQILGAEKALFRALKANRDTPKYGLIYHAQLVSNAPLKMKGKMARMLAAKLSLSARVDCFKETQESEVAVGVKSRARLEAHLKCFQGSSRTKTSSSGGGKQSASWTPKSVTPHSTYDVSFDSTMPSAKTEHSTLSSHSPLIEELSSQDHSAAKPKKKSKFKEENAGVCAEISVAGDESISLDGDAEKHEKKVKKKHRKKHVDTEATDTALEKKEFDEASTKSVDQPFDDSEREKKKKKKKKKRDKEDCSQDTLSDEGVADKESSAWLATSHIVETEKTSATSGLETDLTQDRSEADEKKMEKKKKKKKSKSTPSQDSE